MDVASIGQQSLRWLPALLTAYPGKTWLRSAPRPSMRMMLERLPWEPSNDFPLDPGGRGLPAKRNGSERLEEPMAPAAVDPDRDWAKDPLGLGALLPGPLRMSERRDMPWQKRRERPPPPTQEEQVFLVREVQRLKLLEEIYAELPPDPEYAEDFFPAATAGGGKRSATWAAAAGVTEEELRRQLWQGIAAREQILVLNLGLVYLQVSNIKKNRQFRFGRSTRAGVDIGTTEEDLVQEGTIGLLRAAEQYDASRGIRFSTYAATAILRTVEKALMSQTRIVRVPTYVYVQYKKIKRATGQLGVSLAPGVYPTEEEICTQLALDGLKLTPARLRDIIRQVERQETSLQTPTGSGVRVLLDILPDDMGGLYIDILLDLLRNDLERVLATAVEPLEAAVLRLRFGLDGEQPQTIAEVRANLGVENQDVLRLTKRGLRKLNKRLKKMGIDANYMDDA